MAKANKPTPGGKSASQTSKTAAEKGTGDAEKATVTSSASKAAAAKADKTASTAASAKERSKSTGPAAAGKPEASKPAQAADVTSSSATKAAKSPKSDAPKTADTTKSGTAKADESKSPTDSKAETKAEAKEALAQSPTSAAKTDATAKSDDKGPASTPVAAPATAPQKPPEKPRSVFWPIVFGGVVAAALGFAASEANVFNTRVETTEIQETLERQQQQIAALENAEPPAPETPDLSSIEADLASIAENVATIEVRLTALENRPAPGGEAPAPAADYSEELAALTASVEAQKAEIDRLLENAQSIEEATAEAARRAAIQSALTNISAALNAGGSFSDGVGALSESGVDEVPEAISGPADKGVATLLSLQTEFPDTARAALAAARAAGVDSDEGGMGSFLRRQLGARSVAPREGSDPDAVLSRAEAALREGRLADALTELEALPPEAQAAMQDWLNNARARAEAEAAVEDLSQRLTAN